MTHLRRPMKQACERAQITPSVSFHILRQNHATRMLRRGMPMHQVSKQLGHKSVVIIAKHYAHVIGDDVANAVPELSGDRGSGSGAGREHNRGLDSRPRPFRAVCEDQGRLRSLCQPVVGDEDEASGTFEVSYYDAQGDQRWSPFFIVQKRGNIRPDMLALDRDRSPSRPTSSVARAICLPNESGNQWAAGPLLTTNWKF